MLSQGEAGIDSIISAPITVLTACALPPESRMPFWPIAFSSLIFSFGISTICYFGTYQEYYLRSDACSGSQQDVLLEYACNQALLLLAVHPSTCMYIPFDLVCLMVVCFCPFN